jgi:hypothetical protein
VTEVDDNLQILRGSCIGRKGERRLGPGRFDVFVFDCFESEMQSFDEARVANLIRLCSSTRRRRW